MRRPYGTTGWGQQWLNALNDIDFSNRLPRGRTYANKGAVMAISIDKNPFLVFELHGFDLFKALEVEEEAFIVQWLPALLNEQVRECLILLGDRLEEGLLQFEIGDHCLVKKASAA